MSQMYSAELGDLEADLLICDKRASLGAIVTLYRCREWRNLYFSGSELSINSRRTLVTSSPVIAVLEEYCKMIGSTVEKAFPSWYGKFGRDNSSIKVFATKGCEKLHKALQSFPVEDIINSPNTTTNEKSLFLVPQKLQTSKNISLIKLNF